MLISYVEASLVCVHKWSATICWSPSREISLKSVFRSVFICSGPGGTSMSNRRLAAVLQHGKVQSAVQNRAQPAAQPTTAMKVVARNNYVKQLMLTPDHDEHAQVVT